MKIKYEASEFIDDYGVLLLFYPIILPFFLIAMLYIWVGGKLLKFIGF